MSLLDNECEGVCYKYIDSSLKKDGRIIKKCIRKGGLQVYELLAEEERNNLENVLEVIEFMYRKNEFNSFVFSRFPMRVQNSILKVSSSKEDIRSSVEFLILSEKSSSLISKNKFFV